MKRELVTAFQRYVLNPIVRPGAGILPGVVLLETTGRRTGRPRRVPVGATRDGDTVWVVSEQGRRAGYVRNIQAQPRVRVRSRGHWHVGTATTQPDLDPRQYTRSLNGAIVRLVGTDLLVIRIDLER